MHNFIVNPAAGGGRAVRVVESVKGLLKQGQAEFYYTTHAKHAVELAYGLVKQGEKSIICCGGDGTINEIVNGVLLAGGKDVVLGFLPCGTGNDFMRSAGLPLNPHDALKVILQEKAKPVDCIDISGVKMLCFSNAGIDAEVVKLCNAAPKKTKASYVINLLKSLNKGFYDFKIESAEGTIETRGSMVSVVNGWSIGSGVPYCPLAKIDDGYMDVLVLKTANRAQLIACLIRAVFGKLLTSGRVSYFRCKRVSITSTADAVDIDGELYYDLAYEAKIEENAVNIYF